MRPRPAGYLLLQRTVLIQHKVSATTDCRAPACTVDCGDRHRRWRRGFFHATRAVVLLTASRAIAPAGGGACHRAAARRAQHAADSAGGARPGRCPLSPPGLPRYRSPAPVGRSEHPGGQLPGRLPHGAEHPVAHAARARGGRGFLRAPPAGLGREPRLRPVALLPVARPGPQHLARRRPARGDGAAPHAGTAQLPTLAPGHARLAQPRVVAGAAPAPARAGAAAAPTGTRAWSRPRRRSATRPRTAPARARARSAT